MLDQVVVHWRSLCRVGVVSTGLLALVWLLSGCVESRSIDLLTRMHEENVALRQQLTQAERPVAPAPTPQTPTPQAQEARKPVTSREVLVMMHGKKPFITCVLHTQDHGGYVMWFYGLQEHPEQAVVILFNRGMEAVKMAQGTLDEWGEMLNELGAHATCNDHAGRRLNFTEG
jgi:hypothetical protein